MFELHHILEDGITEDAAGVLGLPRRKWTAGLIEIYGHQRSIAGVTAVLSNLEDREDRGEDREGGREEDREGREGDREDRTGDREGYREDREGYREDRTGDRKGGREDREGDREEDRGQRGWQRGGHRGGQRGGQRGGAQRGTKDREEDREGFLSQALTFDPPSEGASPHLNSVCMLEEVDHNVAPVAGHPPLWSRGGVQDQDSTLTLHTLSNAKRVKGVLAGGMGALITAQT